MCWRWRVSCGGVGQQGSPQGGGTGGSNQEGPPRCKPSLRSPLTYHQPHRFQGWAASSQPQPSADNWNKALLSKAMPTRARQFSHCQSLLSGRLHKPLSLLHQRTDRSKKSHNPTARIKTTLGKVNQDEKADVMSQMKGQDKTPEKLLNEIRDSQLSRK